MSNNIALNSSKSPEALNDFLIKMAELEAEKHAATAVGIPALTRLIDVADRDTGQADTVRRFLLGLYNGYAFPFNLVTLRGVDKALFDDCLAVLTLDARVTRQEIHHYIENGGELFERWVKLEGGRS